MTGTLVRDTLVARWWGLCTGWLGEQDERKTRIYTYCDERSWEEDHRNCGYGLHGGAVALALESH
jgi:hypothetical protein